MWRISALFVALVTAAVAATALRPAIRWRAPNRPSRWQRWSAPAATPTAPSYLLDKAGNDYRVFMGSGLELRRKRVAGSSEFAVAGGRAVTVSVTEAEPPFRLKVEMTGGTSRMGVLRGMTDVRDFVIGQQGDVLAPLTVAEVQALQLHNLGGGVFVEYAAEIPDGRRLVVTRPQDDWGYEDFRLFLGPPERVEERKVSSVQRARDGGTTTIRSRSKAPPPRRSSPPPRT